MFLAAGWSKRYAYIKQNLEMRLLNAMFRFRVKCHVYRKSIEVTDVRLNSVTLRLLRITV